MTATTLPIYDIPSDRLRTKVANACLDYGVERIQYSAFQGTLTHNRQGELLQRGVASECCGTRCGDDRWGKSAGD